MQSVLPSLHYRVTGKQTLHSMLVFNKEHAMNNSLDLFSNDKDYIDTSDVDYVEAGHYFTLLDASHLIDNMGVVPFLREATRLMNSPQEQHVLTQLLRIAETHERVLLKMERADEVLHV